MHDLPASTAPKFDRALRALVWGGAGALLLLPAVAMRFTSEVDWTALDFVVMGVLLAVVCAGVELGLRLSRDGFYRAGFAAAAGGFFLTVWINLAVGAIGTEDDPANLMFAGVLAVLVCGAFAVRFRAAGMLRVLLATSAAQVLAALVAGIAGWGLPESGPLQLAGVTLFFLVPWLTAAALFAKAAARGVR